MNLKALIIAPVPDFAVLALVRGLKRQFPRTLLFIGTGLRPENGCTILAADVEGQPVDATTRAEMIAYIRGYSNLWTKEDA